ncbi:MAG: hypothetical protein M3Q36_00710 [bacterium]|nr:hypothetical protein [bacterium]
MKIQNKSPRKKIIIGSAIGFLLLLGVAFYSYQYWSQLNESATTGDVNKVDYNPPTDDQKTAGEKIKEQSIEKDELGKPGTDGPESGQGNDENINVTITSANQQGSILRIRSLIDIVTNTGTCTITLTKGSAVVTKTSDIQAMANSSTCKGFDIPTSELSAGQWHIQLNVSSNNRSGTTAKDITIQ